MRMEEVSFYFGPVPRCLQGFTALPVSVPGALLDGHGSPLNSVFSLACACGSVRHLAHGFRPPGEQAVDALLFSPLALECTVCGRRTDLFDSHLHGYDAEQGLYAGSSREVQRPAVYGCPDCGRQPFEAFARFEHFASILSSRNPRHAGRHHDLFTWFSLIGACGRCRLLQLLAHFECA